MHTFVICLQKEPLHIALWVPGGSSEARKGRALFQPRAVLSKPQVTSAQKPRGCANGTTVHREGHFGLQEWGEKLYRQE